MSAAAIEATATTPITHLPRTAHPIPLREQAFTLHCQGLRSPAIADQLGVPERTIRSWIAAALQDIKEDQQLSRREQLALAVERQRALTVAAWQQFDAESAVRAALLDACLATITHPDPAVGTPATLRTPNAPTTATTAPNAAGASARPSSLHLHLPASTPAPRYLSLILQANKEINRLLGLYTLARLELLSPEPPLASSIFSDLSDESTDPAPAPTDDDIPSAAETAAAPATDDPALAAETATDSPTVPPSPACRPPAMPAPAVQSRDSSSPAESASIPPVASPCPSVACVPSVLNPRIPAESATAPGRAYSPPASSASISASSA